MFFQCILERWSGMRGRQWVHMSNQCSSYFWGWHTWGDLSLLLVPATSRGDKSHSELSSFASNSSLRDQLWSSWLVQQIQTSLNFLDKSLHREHIILLSREREKIKERKDWAVYLSLLLSSFLSYAILLGKLLLTNPA